MSAVSAWALLAKGIKRVRLTRGGLPQALTASISIIAMTFV